MLRWKSRAARHGDERDDRWINLARARTLVRVLGVPGRDGRVMDGGVQVRLDSRIIAGAVRSTERHFRCNLVPSIWWCACVPVGDPIQHGRVGVPDHPADLRELATVIGW